MKKFLLIIAVATAGLIPQLALCNAKGLVDATKALTFYKIKHTYPGVDPLQVAPALAKDEVTGSNEKHTDGDCPYAQDKKVQGTPVKILDGESPGRTNRAGQAG